MIVFLIYFKKKGGVICAVDGTELSIENSSFLNNSSPLIAGVFVIQERAKFSLINSYVQGNHAADVSVFLVFDIFSITLEIVNTTFELNFGKTTMFDVSDSSLVLENCIFVNNNNPTIYLIKTDLKIFNLTHFNNTCDNLILGCLLSANQYSTLLINSANIMNMLTKKTQIGAILSLNSSLQMKNVVFSDIKSIGTGSCIYSQYTDLQIKNSNFSYFFPSCIYVYGGNFSFNGVTMSNSQVESSPLIVEDIEGMNITLSTFSNNTGAPKGGALLIDSTNNSTQSKVLIIQSKFYNNKALMDGGAIYISNQYLEIWNSTLEKNNATRGGAIFFDAANDSFADLDLNTVDFISNEASLEGGAIKSTAKLPKFKSSVSTLQNLALYGNDFGSYPIRIVFQIFDTQNNSGTNFFPF